MPRYDGDYMFRGYESLLGGLNATSPQRQGFREHEFFDALRNPNVVTTSLDTLAGPVEVPQLCPIDQYSWLNSEYYKNRFPDDVAAGRIKHFFEIPGIEPGQAVKNSIVSIGEQNGLIVFDYSERDDAYMNRFEGMIDALGLEIESVEEMGTQTYYAGKCKLNKEKTNGQDEHIHDTFRRMIADGVLPVEQSSGATYHELMTQEQASALYGTYEAAFANLNNHPCRQGIDADEFHEILTKHPDVIKLVNKFDGEVTTLCLLDDDLSKFEWLNPSFYETEFPNEAADNELIYFPAIHTNPDLRGVMGAKDIVQLLARMSAYGKHEVVVAFDCCDMNRDSLPNYIARLINSTPELKIDFDVIGTQIYRAARLRPKNNLF